MTKSLEIDNYVKEEEKNEIQPKKKGRGSWG